MERKTFYLHYTSIEALYEDILSELSKDYYQATCGRFFVQLSIPQGVPRFPSLS